MFTPTVPAVLVPHPYEQFPQNEEGEAVIQTAENLLNALHPGTCEIRYISELDPDSWNYLYQGPQHTGPHNIGVILETDDPNYSIFTRAAAGVVSYDGELKSKKQETPQRQELITFALAGRPNMYNAGPIKIHMLTRADCERIEAETNRIIHNWKGPVPMRVYKQLLANIMNGFLVYPPSNEFEDY